MILQVLKLITATGLAVWLAQNLGLDNASSAGILAMLSLLDTRKSSLKLAWQRLISTLVALFLAYVAFGSLGFNLLAFLLYLLVFASFALYFEMKPVLAPCSVLVTHLWIAQDLSLALLGNELLLMLIGAGMAILLHAYMPSRQEAIKELRLRLELGLRDSLYGLANSLYQGESLGQRQDSQTLTDLITEAKILVYQEQDNQLFSQLDYDLHYFDMRQGQLTLLLTMQDNLEVCRLDSHEAKLLASLFELTANQLDEHNPATYLLEDIEQMLAHFRERDLPKDRQEFETRAILFQLLTDLTRFIQLKIAFYKEYVTSRYNQKS